MRIVHKPSAPGANLDLINWFFSSSDLLNGYYCVYITQRIYTHTQRGLFPVSRSANTTLSGIRKWSAKTNWIRYNSIYRVLFHQHPFTIAIACLGVSIRGLRAYLIVTATHSIWKVTKLRMERIWWEVWTPTNELEQSPWSVNESVKNLSHKSILYVYFYVRGYMNAHRSPHCTHLIGEFDTCNHVWKYVKNVIKSWQLKPPNISCLVLWMFYVSNYTKSTKRDTTECCLKEPMALNRYQHFNILQHKSSALKILIYVFVSFSFCCCGWFFFCISCSIFNFSFWKSFMDTEFI